MLTHMHACNSLYYIVGLPSLAATIARNFSETPLVRFAYRDNLN